MKRDEQDDRELEALDSERLARWREGETLTTLDLRAARHAADREGDSAAVRELDGILDVREAKGQTG